MSTRSTSSNLFSPLRDPESLIRRRNLGEPSPLFDCEEVMSIPHNNQGSPPVSPPPPNNNGPPSVVRPNGPAPRSMEELCQPTINGRGGPIASIPIQATDFRLRHHMIQQVQNTYQFHGLPGDDANRHIDKFLEVTQHMKQNRVSDDALRLSLFPYLLTHHATTWYDRLPRNSIHTFDDMMRKFLSKCFCPSMVTKLRNEITKFRQDPNESLFEAWERYKLSIDRHRDTINAAAGGTFMQKTPEECYELIENMTAHHNHWDTSATRYETSRNISSTTTTESLENDETTMAKHHNELKNMMSCFLQMQSPLGSGSLPSNTVANQQGDMKAITTQSGVAYDGPTIPPTSSPILNVVERETEDKVQTTSLESTAHVQPLVVQVTFSELDVALKPNPKPLHFDLSFADALYIPKFASTFKSRLSNKEKLFELANTPLTKNCSMVLLKKLPEKLGDPRRFLIPCEFQRLESCMALADLGGSINLMPLSVWKKLSLPDLTPTRMTLDLATRSFAYPAGIAEDVFMQVGKFTFPADFVVVDYDVNPYVPLILGRPFLRTAHALVNVHGEELILRDSNENLIFHANSTLKHLHKHGNDTTPLSDFSPSLTPFETNDSLLEEFANELALLDLFTSGKKDNNFDFEADLRETGYLLNQDPTTESNIKTIKPILEKFTDEPALDYLPPSGHDDDDLFDLRSNNDEWKKILYGDCYKDIDSEKDKNKDSKKKSLVIEAHIFESNNLLPQLLESESNLPEESYEIATLSSSPFGNKDKVFNQGILGRIQIFKDESKDNDLKDKDLILKDRDFFIYLF
nr:reverse transcriptase domain-containing protein [Tanacetum cinerariifolium]